MVVAETSGVCRSVDMDWMGPKAGRSVAKSELMVLDGNFGTLFRWRLGACMFLGVSTRGLSKCIQKDLGGGGRMNGLDCEEM